MFANWEKAMKLEKIAPNEKRIRLAKEMCFTQTTICQLCDFLSSLSYTVNNDITRRSPKGRVTRVRGSKLAI